MSGALERPPKAGSPAELAELARESAWRSWDEHVSVHGCEIRRTVRVWNCRTWPPTCFHKYVPHRCAASIDPPLSAEQREGHMEPDPKNKKTILVVDDDPKILAIVSELLGENVDYHILTARTGSKGLEQSRNFKGEIHLLLSDFQMPGMSGTDLATVMTMDRPGLKVLLMSGFQGGTLILNEGWHFLPKPFVASRLRALVTGLVSPDAKSKFSK
jgi:CheY-like chemotaxis protein